MQRFFIFTLTLASVFFTVLPGYCQKNENDTSKKATFFNNIFNRIKGSITVSNPDSTERAAVLNAKSVNPFIEYKDKIIRSITTQELGFEKVFTDTSKSIDYYGTRILNALHTNTYDWVIRH